MTKYLFVASLSAVVGLSASANTQHYPDVKSSSADTHSATSARVQDPTNPNGAYDTDKSGYANRWNAEDRISAQPQGESRWHGRGMDGHNAVTTNDSSTNTTVTTTRSGADVDSTDTAWNSERPRAYQEPDRTTVNTTMSGTTDSNAKVNEDVSDTSYRADNSAMNKRDRNENADTADHQASKGMKGDVEVTRKIRRELTKDDSLSTYGKNVKIISKNGQVTLRGPVNNSEEKDKIENAAEKIVGTNKVRNELEIKH